jgi:hypothetical protein
VSDSLDDRLETRAGEVLELLAQKNVRRHRHLRSPEFRKNLDRVYTAIRDTQRLRQVGRLENHHEKQLERLLLHPDRLTQLNSDALGLMLESVDQVLVDAGDDQLIDAMLAIEYVREKDERGGPIPTWSTIYKEDQPTGLADKKQRLSKLLRTRHTIYALRRAREGTRATRLVWLAPILFGLVLLIVGLADWIDPDASWSEGLFVAGLGAAGATVAAGIKLRDALARLSDLRVFWYAFALQLALGAVSGVFIWIVLESGLVEVTGTAGNEWAVFGALAFVAGFSEPFLLRTVERIAGGSDVKQAK